MIESWESRAQPSNQRWWVTSAAITCMNDGQASKNEGSRRVEAASSKMAAAPSPISADAIIHARHRLIDTLRVAVPQSTAAPFHRRTLNVTFQKAKSKQISRQVQTRAGKNRVFELISWVMSLSLPGAFSKSVDRVLAKLLVISRRYQ